MLFDFKKLVQKFSKTPPIMLIEQGGYYDYENGGEYVQGTITKKEFEGAIVPLSYQELKYEENGRYKSEDRKLYCYKHFEIGDKIEHKKHIFTIDKKKDYSDFDENLHIYYLIRSDTLGTDHS
ncbi:MAG: hypothetical protein ACTTHM_04610 [Peptoanaerobacter stomatis]|uniref:hypothetical protein n=1 Tax=Peptoanaerobacter stomatis TaxID=796937 RepID=UPI003F9F39DA